VIWQGVVSLTSLDGEVGLRSGLAKEPRPLGIISVESVAGARSLAESLPTKLLKVHY
jgi:hypothetical protein